MNDFERELEELRLRSAFKAMPRRGCALSKRQRQNIQRESLSDSRICRSLREILHLRVRAYQRDMSVFMSSRIFFSTRFGFTQAYE